MKNRIKKILIGIGIVFVLVASFVTIKDEVFYWLFSDSSAGEGGQATLCSEAGNVALLKIHGGIVNYKLDSLETQPEYADTVSSENIVADLEMIENNDAIKAIIVEIDSPGGIGVAGDNEFVVEIK